MKILMRCLLVALCLALPWIVQSLAPSAGRLGWHLTDAPAPAEAHQPGSPDNGAQTAGADPHARFDSIFVSVPESVWTDRDVLLPEDSLRAMLEQLATAGLSRAELSRERTRLGAWLDEHRAGSALDLPGVWHGALRLVDSAAEREYETNRRKRKLLGRLLTALPERT